MRQLFTDRADAGRALAASLAAWRSAPDAVVLALPRGGVPVAYEVASALELPLDVLVVRKLGLPWQPELAMGAIASGGAIVLNPDVIRYLPAGSDVLESVRAAETAELHRRELQYRGELPPLELSGRVAIVVDDGLATGATMEAAVRSLVALGARRVVVAVPVAAVEARERIAAVADEVVCAYTPEFFSAVGQWYRNFDQTSDDEVRDLLARARATLAAGAGRGGGEP
jgi:predicted phosphoribosyltransferase